MMIFTVLVTAFTAVIFGTAPAYRISRFDLSHLKEASRVTSAKSSERARGFLVVVEISLAIVLLAGTGLMIRTIWSIDAVDPGFKPNDVLTIETNLSDMPRYVAQVPQDAQKLSPAVDVLYAHLLERASRLPGVESAAYTSDLPDTGIQTRTFTIAGRLPPLEGERPYVGYYEVIPEFFHAMHIPVRLGRVFDSNDRTGTEWTTVVDEAFAKK